MISDERKEELQELVGNYAGGGPGSTYFGRDNNITSEEWGFIYDVDGLNVGDCGECGWPEYNEDMEEDEDSFDLVCWRCKENLQEEREENERLEEEDE